MPSRARQRAVLFACAASLAAAADFGPLDSLIRREVREKSLPAFAIAVVDGERVVWTRTYGAARPDTVYRIGSVSKLFTDIGIMQLVERGEIDLDAPVTRYLPEFHPRNPFGGDITLRQLMSHRSGLVREPPVGHYFDNTGRSLADTVRSLNDTELVYAPGTHTKYSNAAIAVVGYVLERLQGKPFASYLSARILEPLGMRHSAFLPLPSVPKATMWTLWGRSFDAPTFELGMAPCGSMYSTVSDLSLFLSALFAGGRGIVKAQTLQQMWTPQSGTFGIGFQVGTLDGQRMIGHGGAIYGFATQISALPDDHLGVVTVTTKDSANAVTSAVATRALRLMLGQPAGMDTPIALPAPPARTWTPETPSAPPSKWPGLIGEYGWDYDVLYIHERDGKLQALIEWFDLDALTEVSENVFRWPQRGLYDGETVTFTRDASGRATAVRVGGVVFPRRPDPAAAGGVFRIHPVRPVADLRREALRLSPPKESGEFRAPDLVDVATLDPSIRLDIRYAGTDNFLTTPVYTSARAFLQRPAAEALARAAQALKAQGFGILVHDAYRPWYVTKVFWDATPPDKHAFVADPSQGSRHNRGCAIDMSIYDVKTGKPVEMTGVYDEMSDRSYPDYVGGTSRQRWHRELLRRAMEAQGFTVNEAEWWHFDYRDWRHYGIQNAPFERLVAPAGR